MIPLYCVAQLGARMHYAVPRILAEVGRLERLFTDICAVRGWPRLLQLVPPMLRPGSVRRLLARVPEGIPRRLINTFGGLGWEYARRRHHARTATEITAAHLWAAREFGQLVVAKGLGRATGVYCFNSAALEILQTAREAGLRTVLEQTIAPKRIERSMLQAEQERFPEWDISADQDALADTFSQREEAEWHAADLILCGSEFVRDGVATCQGPVERCVVVPYGVSIPTRQTDCQYRRAPRQPPLRVLTVGTVSLRKGSPYVLEAARQLSGRAEFRMVGSIRVSTAAQARLRECVELVGPVPRSEVTRHFEWADVFLLPSVCEGSATVTYEALAHGLPVICTRNTGSVVRDGIEGFLVSVGDVASMVDRLSRFLEVPILLAEMSGAARSRASSFTLRAYGDRLLATLGQAA